MPKVIDGAATVIDGEGARCEPTTRIIDSFERASSDPGGQYSGDTLRFEIVDAADEGITAPDGKRLLKNGGDSFSEIWSVSGNGFYPEKGDVFWYWAQASGADTFAGFGFGWDDEYDSGYLVRPELGSVNFAILEVDGSDTVLANTSNADTSLDTPYYTRVIWDDGTHGGTDNDITATLFDASGGSLSEVSELTTNDSTHENDTGVAWRCNGPSGWTCYYDHGYIDP